MKHKGKRRRRKVRFVPRPDVAKANTPKATSPLYVNAALIAFAMIGLAVALAA